MHLKLYAGFLSTLFLLSFFLPVSAQVGSKTLQEIQLLVQEKNSRTATQRKLDSHLLQFIREKQGQKMAAGVNLEQARIAGESNGNLKVDIDADVSDQLLS